MKQQSATKSSQMVSEFLDKNSLHKKDFAQMIGVTLSYVYNLIDNAIPFSTRSTTLERIATVMDINPEEFSEYKIPQEPLFIDKSTELIKRTIKDKGMNIVDFLKNFPRKKRLELVDMLRGAIPLTVDYSELKNIGEILGMEPLETYLIWEKRIKQTLESAGMNLNSNSELIKTMFDCAKKYIIEK